jgi:phosphocarrier protein HPr
MNKPVTRVIVIRNKQGLHARPATLFVKLANEFRSEIFLVRGNERIDARSMMELLTFGAGMGTQLVLEARGDDAHDAVEALAQLVEVGFLDEDAEDEQSQAEESC